MPFHTVELYSQYVRTSIYLLEQGLHGFITQGEGIWQGCRLCQLSSNIENYVWVFIEETRLPMTSFVQKIAIESH